MAYQAVTAVALNRNAVTDISAAYTTIDSTLVGKGVKILYPEQDQLVIHIKNSATVALEVTVQASDADFAFSKGLGDLVQEVALSGDVMFAGLEQTRFKYNDGYIYIDFETGFTGSIAAFTTL